VPPGPRRRKPGRKKLKHLCQFVFDLLLALGMCGVHWCPPSLISPTQKSPFYSTSFSLSITTPDDIDESFPSGSGIYFISRSGAKPAIEFFDLSTEKIRRVYEFEKPVPGYIGAMPDDGRRTLAPRHRLMGNKSRLVAQCLRIHPFHLAE
jgi:hypothetical protein